MGENKAIGHLHRVADDAKISDLKVTEFMVPPEIKISHEAKIYVAIQGLGAHKISGAPVINAHGKIVGVISEYDLLLQAATKDLSSPIEYTKEFLSLQPSATLRDCLVLLYKNKIRRIPIVDVNQHVVGMVSRMDVLNRLIRPKRPPGR